MSDVKQVKVDNWGIYFLQRLKHFFNRTDYCDLTLQFQDNAQLKVHRLVLSACTEYFELLERTCEMYEDCLVMPDDLQADVVVPIVNFMYTGQLEFKMDLLESLYQTSQIMNMPVLTKLLEAHRQPTQPPKLNYNATRRSYSKTAITPAKPAQKQPLSSNATSNKRSHSKAFGSPVVITQKEKRQFLTVNKSEGVSKNGSYTTTSTPILYSNPVSSARKIKLAEPRPTRYELPEEIDNEDVFDSSFTNISYTSQPLIVHPETTKRYAPKKSRLFDEPSSSKRGNSTMDIVECKRVSKDIDDAPEGLSEDTELFATTVKQEPVKDSSHLFDQILDNEEGPKVTIETKDKESGNIDHAKIISEVLKKYPHLVKSNKNIKLRILNTPSTASTPRKPKKTQPQTAPIYQNQNTNKPDYTFETDVLDSKEAARLIALGAENIHGPWICLICGAPGRALHFPSYYKFRRHLVEIHNEKPVSKMCEYCGLKSLKRNYLLHHLYTKHGVPPPPAYHFPKCELCDYVALTESFLVKHKLTSHGECRNFRCNVCPASYATSKELLAHIRTTGHKYVPDRRTNLQCVYCSKVFLRENNLYAHLRSVHNEAAQADGIIDLYEDENIKERPDIKPNIVKYEPPSYDDENEDDDEEDETESQYHLEQNPDGNMHLVPNKPASVTLTPNKQKILNSGLTTTTTQIVQKAKSVKTPVKKPDFVQEVRKPSNKSQTEEIVMIDNKEYVLKGNQLIQRNKKDNREEFILPETEVNVIPASTEYSNIREPMSGVNITPQKIILDKTRNINQPIQIVVSNEDEYKALMGANHGIIFDQTDSNKTLTVLGTPHTSLNATTLDINAQTNEMMIIPNNYQLNTSQALPVDNSNIVVVYSDQIISSQDIGAQFVQSSAVVTQNYETVTTTTPVMGAQLIDTQDVVNWQKNVEGNINTPQTQMILSDELQQTVIEEEAELASVENTTTDSLDELPAVNVDAETGHQDLASVQETKNAVQCGEEQVSEENIIDVDEQEIQDGSSAVMEIDNVTDNVAEKSIHGDSDQAVLTIISNKSDNINISEDQLIDESSIVEHVPEINEPEEIAENPEEPPDLEISQQAAQTVQTEDSANQPEHYLQETVENTELNDDENVTQESVVHEHDEGETNVTNESSDQEPSKNITDLDQNSLTKTVAPEQLATLTSEWSEEEEVTEQELNNPVEGDAGIETCDTTMAVISSENRRQSTEETIENIQQEMQKQILIDNTEIGMQQSCEKNIKVLDKQQHELQEQEATPPQEKISSLLNDWEDNDSQDEEVPENNEQSPENDLKEDEIQKNGENTEPKNDDKIKSLVSDWDDVDDEEENKTE